MTVHHGHCRCGSISIRTTGPTHFAGYCHCDDCRRSNGAPIVSFAGFEKQNFEWASKGTLSKWRNGDYARLFCNRCGTPIAYTDDKVPEVTFFYAAFMDDPEAFPPEHHSYHKHKIEWLKLSDDLPKFENTSYPRPE